MTFRWDQVIPDEWPQGEPPSIWVYVVSYLIIECLAVAITIGTWPKGRSVASAEFVLDVLVIPLLVWGVICITAYTNLFATGAFFAAVFNTQRWHLITGWQRRCRSGVAVLDSVMLTPEPDLAERMLALDGSPPVNPGKVMRLDDIVAENEAPRLRAVLEKLLMPLLPKLPTAARSGSFEILMQCEHAESSSEVHAVWKKLGLQGEPRIVWAKPDLDIQFVNKWFDRDRVPAYRLVLAWHLNDDAPDAPPHSCSESAVALLLASADLMRQKGGSLKCQAWLLRQIVSDADRVDHSLSLLLNAEQVPRERIQHFWHSRLKGLAQHATMGAIKESGLKTVEHALDKAAGQQSPVARWLLQALAAKMAHYGQGAQLLALPHGDGVALNLAAKESTPVKVPWKASYNYSLFPFYEFAALSMLLGAILLFLPGDGGWSTGHTLFSCMIALFFVLSIVMRLVTHKLHIDRFWRDFG
ncbi:hypothetical protein [Burkholderia ubonensis]|uniref:hypothetical protein n=1 Tax=Burkholderia ubonensis TaxID=101571 RepID=UPI00075DEE1A|nr:hypothetical protein [Burkholderia ubonensis]KVG68983.1 hypothetical protein WJ34_32860 [Burkholderia ubonensis]KVH22238.1 hypothetical protein WJ37_14370 [Burkholderia ubonensis]KVH50861.1 hypothetical protein WJ38_01100 [Burkholderia ubonensis]KVH81234.1 hypothetical protein WJ43_30220 [Burkholderia ubonensis]KVM27851.1 hypothetical protein WJ55_27775 [Burkholderia ubonensis]